MAASNRFAQAIAAGEVSLWYAALGETLWWIVGLDEHYRTVGRGAYIAFQQSDVDGRVIPGLRYACNFVGHQLTLMLYDPSGASLFASANNATVTLFQPVWRPSGHLPLPDREQRTQRRSYGQHLADNAVRFSIRRARKFLVGKGDELDGRFA